MQWLTSVDCTSFTDLQLKLLDSQIGDLILQTVSESAGRKDLITSSQQSMKGNVFLFWESSHFPPMFIGFSF